MIDTLVMCPAFSTRFFGTLTSRIRKLPLRFVDVPYPARDSNLRLATVRNSIAATLQDLWRDGTRPQDTAILGYSLGGYLGVQAAASLPEKPGAFILLAAPASWALRRTEPSFDNILSAYGSRGIDTDALVKEMQEILPTEEAAVVAGRLGVPLLYLHGKTDANISAQHPQRFREHVGPLATIVELEGDHFLHGQEARLAREMRRFLQEIAHRPA